MAVDASSTGTGAVTGADAVAGADVATGTDVATAVVPKFSIKSLAVGPSVAVASSGVVLREDLGW